mmetsp:Transcript_1244/g.1683  ORF Transcript_1244/g.1683 Transcript_1244/m.1683 type:complete len:210 (-) Transcript_1244:8-637(-)
MYNRSRNQILPRNANIPIHGPGQLWILRGFRFIGVGGEGCERKPSGSLDFHPIDLGFGVLCNGGENAECVVDAVVTTLGLLPAANHHQFILDVQTHLLMYLSFAGVAHALAEVHVAGDELPVSVLPDQEDAIFLRIEDDAANTFQCSCVAWYDIVALSTPTVVDQFTWDSILVLTSVWIEMVELEAFLSKVSHNCSAFGKIVGDANIDS